MIQRWRAQFMIEIINETRDNVPSDILGNIWTQVISYHTKTNGNFTLQAISQTNIVTRE